MMMYLHYKKDEYFNEEATPIKIDKVPERENNMIKLHYIFERLLVMLILINYKFQSFNMLVNYFWSDRKINYPFSFTNCIAISNIPIIKRFRYFSLLVEHFKALTPSTVWSPKQNSLLLYRNSLS